MLQGGLFEVTSQLLELSLALLVHLNLSSSGTTGLLQPLTDLLKFPGEISSLLLNLGTSSTLSLNLLLQFLNTGLLNVDVLSFSKLSLLKHTVGNVQRNILCNTVCESPEAP